MKRLQPLAHLYVQTSQRRFFRLTYSNTGPEDEPKLFQGRDGIAFNEVGAALIAHGYEYGTTIHFYPDDERRLTEFPPLRDTDLMVLTTRPPLTDREAFLPPKKIIRNSKNDLEKLIFKQLFRYFAHCTRKQLKLTPDAQACLLADARKWQSLEFFEVSGVTHPYAEAHIQKHVASAQKPEGEHPSTVVFLVRVNSLPGVEETPGLACGLLACFGMDGYSTLIWNRIVRLRYPELLTKPGFVMAELVFKKPIPRRPLTPEFATDPAYVEVKLLTKI
jgi:hypothetical protein